VHALLRALYSLFCRRGLWQRKVCMSSMRCYHMSLCLAANFLWVMK